MNIIIKQKEIEAGIKLYLLQQGIQLNGKSTEISFTAGRKDSGLSAEIEINDAEGVTSVIETMIQQQAPVAPVVATPDPLIIPVQVMQVNHSPVAAVFTNDVIQPAPAAIVAQVAEEATPAVQEAVAVDAATKAAVNALFAAPDEADSLDEEEPVHEVAAAEVPWEVDVAATESPAPAVKTVSLFS